MRTSLSTGIAGLVFFGSVLVASDAAALSAGARCDEPRSTTRAADRLERLRSARRGTPGWWPQTRSEHRGDEGNWKTPPGGKHAERRRSARWWVSDRPARPTPPARPARPEPPSYLRRGAQERQGHRPSRSRASSLARQQVRPHRDRWMHFHHPRQAPWWPPFTAAAVVHPRTASSVAGTAYDRGFHPPVP